MTNLEKAPRTHRSHSYGYANTWKIDRNSPLYTGNLSKDYSCTVEDLAKAFECENCPICNRSYASIAEGKEGVKGNPQWHKTWHLWFPDWIVVCRSCHPKIEGKTREEWEIYKRQHFNQPELKLEIDN